jgi:predicted ATPase
MFVEEVTRLLLERGEAGGLQAIPPTLQQSLAARLDRLGEAREVAQIGAVLGRDFTYALHSALGGLDHSALQSALDRLAGADLLIAEGAGHEASYRFKHALIQDAAYDSLLKSRRQALHRRAAEILRDQPERAAAEPEVIAHHFTEAGLDDLAIEWWGKAGDQALRRSAFQEAIAHLGKAIAMADKGAGRKAEGTSGERRHLHAAYGNALLQARGYGATETTEAFARARQGAFGDDAALERLAADYGLWIGSITRGELSAMRAHAETFLRDVEARPDSPEAGVAHRVAGMTHWFAGKYAEARGQLERALSLFQPGRDDDLAFRFGNDAGVMAMMNLAHTLWPLGDIGRAVSVVGDAAARIACLAHIGTRAYGKWSAAMFELMRGDLSRAAPNAAELARLAGEHDLPLWRAWGVFLDGLAQTVSGAARGLDAMRRGAELLREQNSLINDGLIRIALAEAEARAGDVDRALAVLDEALATSERIGHRAFDAELNRVRGEILLKRNPANPATAEEAFQIAIAVAKQQATRSFELRAALALAKLYQSTDRPVDAHTILAPALEGFSPTPAMPEIAEAQALLAALAEMDEVKARAAKRDQRLRLQVAYGAALVSTRGHGAPETKASFDLARELARGGGDPVARFSALYGDWVRALFTTSASDALEVARMAMAETSGAEDSLLGGVAHRMIGVSLGYLGDFRASGPYLDKALGILDSKRDADLVTRFNDDPLIGARIRLAFDAWVRGETQVSKAHAERAVVEAKVLGHASTLCYVHGWKATLGALQRNPTRALVDAEAALAVATETGVRNWIPTASVVRDWALCARDRAAFGAAQLRELHPALHEVGHDAIYDQLFACIAAEAEAAAGRFDEALALARDALAGSARTRFAWFDAELRRVAGDIEARRGDIEAAEAELIAALDLARQQGARAFELRAALALAKLYNSTARPAEAHAILAPALEGFSPTPEMPEIAEAQALLAALAESDEVKAEAAARQRRLQLETRYGQAMMYSRGFASDESKTAFARARTLAAGVGDASERFDACYGLFVGSLLRGELSLAH